LSKNDAQAETINVEGRQLRGQIAGPEMRDKDAT
jgi:hypothetical protein